MSIYNFVSGLGVLAGAMLFSSVASAQAIRQAPIGEVMRPANRAVVCMATSANENAFGAAETNAVRKARGLGHLRPSKKLADAAARHACDMARRNEMTHRGSTTKGPSQRVRAAGYKTRIVAENIGKGFPQADGVLDAWVRSTGHLENILLPQVRDFGIGKAVAADGQTGYWAAVYAADS